VIKPTELSAQIRPFQYEGQGMLALGVLVGFPFDSSAPPFSEQDLWTLAAEYLKDWDVFDEGMPKQKGEYLVYGSYHSKEPMAADQVQVQVGELNKTLKVTGQREWRKLVGSTNPEPFTELPITFDRAFGGETIDANPVGIGADGILLPQIEHPDSLFTHPKKTITSAGLTARNILWAPRKDQWGTYNERWLQNDSPGFARDIQWDIFQIAPEDQWKKEGFWQGGESFRIKNMNADSALVEGNLPDVRIRLFALKSEDFFEIPTKHETVWLYPNEQAQISCYRGQVAIETFDGSEIIALLAAYENVSDEQKSLEHYSEALLIRLTPEGDVDDPEDLALRPNGKPLSELNPAPESVLTEALLPGAEGAMSLGALAALAKMKGGKGSKQEAPANDEVEGKVDDAAAPEIEVGTVEEETQAQGDDPESIAKAEAVAKAEAELNEAMAESMESLDEMLEVMSEQQKSIESVTKATLEGLGLSSDAFANLQGEGALEELVNATLPLGSPKIETLTDPEVLDSLLSEPSELAKQAAAAGLESDALGENKGAIDKIIAGESLSDESINELLSEKALSQVDSLAKAAELDKALDPKVMDAINKSTK
jgi:hypothetical protein